MVNADEASAVIETRRGHRDVAGGADVAAHVADTRIGGVDGQHLAGIHAATIVVQRAADIQCQVTGRQYLSLLTVVQRSRLDFHVAIAPERALTIGDLATAVDLGQATAAIGDAPCTIVDAAAGH